MIVICPKCSGKLTVPDDAVGKQARCSACQAVFVVESDGRSTENLPGQFDCDDSKTDGMAVDCPFALQATDSFPTQRAKQKSARAAFAMFTVVGLSVLRIGSDSAYAYATMYFGLGDELKFKMLLPAGVYFLAVCPLVVAMVLGATALKRQGSRWLMFAGAGASFIVGLSGCIAPISTYSFHVAIEEMVMSGRPNHQISETMQLAFFGLGLLATVLVLAQGVIGFSASVMTLGVVKPSSRSQLQPDGEKPFLT